jgi:protein SCO1/2
MIYKALSALVVSGAGLYAYLEYTKQHRPTQQTSIGKPLIGGPFSLVDFNGIPVTDLTYRGKYMLLYFGYTFCPDVCPEELEKMARIVDTVGTLFIPLITFVEAAKGDAIVPIFISVDPKRDSLKAIKEYCAGTTTLYN